MLALDKAKTNFALYSLNRIFVRLVQICEISATQWRHLVPGDSPVGAAARCATRRWLIAKGCLGLG